MNPNTVYADGDWAIHIAASTGILELVVYLADKGADIWVLNALNQSPMDVAYACGHRHVVRYLQKKTASDMHKLYTEFHALSLAVPEPRTTYLA